MIRIVRLLTAGAILAALCGAANAQRGPGLAATNNPDVPCSIDFANGQQGTLPASTMPAGFYQLPFGTPLLIIDFSDQPCADQLSMWANSDQAATAAPAFMRLELYEFDTSAGALDGVNAAAAAATSEGGSLLCYIRSSVTFFTIPNQTGDQFTSGLAYTVGRVLVISSITSSAVGDSSALSYLAGLAPYVEQMVGQTSSQVVQATGCT